MIKPTNRFAFIILTVICLSNLCSASGSTSSPVNKKNDQSQSSEFISNKSEIQKNEIKNTEINKSSKSSVSQDSSSHSNSSAIKEDSLKNVNSKLSVDLDEEEGLNVSINKNSVDQNEELKILLNKSRSKYENLKAENEEVQTCSKPLLHAFGIEGGYLDKSIKASPLEKSFCRRNRMTCCTGANIFSTNANFAKGAMELKAKFEVIEEFFALFTGPKFLDFITEHNGNDKCNAIVKDMTLEIKGHDYGFFDITYMRYQMEMVQNLLMDTELYVKKNMWFFGDTICSICNPQIQEYFTVSEEESSIKMHINTCSERIEEKEYEKNLVLIYENFVKKTIEFIDCVQEDDAEEGEAQEDTDKKYGLLPLDSAQVEKFLSDFEKCWDDQNVDDEDCKVTCTKSLRVYKFPIDNIFHNFQVSLSIMYNTMTGKDIAEYYEIIKEKEWKIEDDNTIIEFFPENEDWRKYKMNDIIWDFHASKGHNMYKEIMAKKYMNFKYENVAIYGVIISLVAILFV